MEHRNSASSKDNGGLFTALLQMYGCGSQTGSDDSIPGITSTNCQPESQASCLKTESRSSYMSDLSTYMESFPSDMETSNFAFSVETSSRMGCPPEVSPRMPSETLLEAISVAQRRLQHLEVIVRMMIQWRGQPHMAQQYHSLWMEYTSIMSQFSAATKFVSFSPPFQTSPSLAPLAIDTFDFELDGFNDGDLYKTLGEDGGLPRPPTSGMDVMLSGVCQGIGLSLPPWTMDVSATPLEPMASSDEVANILARAHTHGIRDENTKEKGTLANPPKIGKAHYALEIHDQMPIPTDEIREDDDDGDCESLPPGSYELIELAATEILAEHTHFCEICGKGFKRDANLRMHMRGHGDEYKTAAALARPDKLHRDSPAMKLRRYSCPYAGCKRNKKHQKFQPLKTMLCVKNHYRRSHCPKVLVCSRCTSKKFSVVADLKTHEKHCGQDKWQCSCGTTFSRKDKLHGHIGLFAGHAPATPAHEAEGVENFRGSTEVLTSSYTNALGIPANVTENNDKTSHDGNQRLDVYKMPAMVTKTHESDKGSYMEDSLNERGNGCSFMS